MGFHAALALRPPIETPLLSLLEDNQATFARQHLTAHTGSVGSTDLQVKGRWHRWLVQKVRVHPARRGHQNQRRDSTRPQALRLTPCCEEPE